MTTLPTNDAAPSAEERREAEQVGPSVQISEVLKAMCLGSHARAYGIAAQRSPCNSRANSRKASRKHCLLDLTNVDFSTGWEELVVMVPAETGKRGRHTNGNKFRRRLSPVSIKLGQARTRVRGAQYVEDLTSRRHGFVSPCATIHSNQTDMHVNSVLSAALGQIQYGGGAKGPAVMSLFGPLRTYCECPMNDSLSSHLLSPNLLRQIRDGNAILFLGAGASHGAKHRTNGYVPCTVDLRDALSDRFLGGNLKDRSLADVAEYAKNESSLDEVQQLVYDLFEPLMPASFHRLIPSFRWHAIVTTNYDFIIERAYAAHGDALQQVRRIVRNGDARGGTIGKSNVVPLLKLHGCLSSIGDASLPLILSTEEYSRHRENRDRVFDLFSGWARNHPVVFCGYRISDPNIQQILFDLGDQAIHRPSFAVIDANLTEFDVRYWQSRRFIPHKSSFESFLVSLDGSIPQEQRQLAMLRSSDRHSIHRHLTGVPSPSLMAYLDDEAEHVHEGLVAESTPAEKFYRGFGDSWGPIVDGLDVDRSIVQDVLLDMVLDPPATIVGKPGFYLIQGYAGSGKSIALRRIAWNAAADHSSVCIWLKPQGSLSIVALRELSELCNERIFVFVDDIRSQLDELQTFVREARQEELAISIVLAARTNEWNVLTEHREVELNGSYEVGPLRNAEIEGLLDLLGSHGCLGQLSTMSRTEQIEYFQASADRQILVALHEATSGRTFEEIVADEFAKIIPSEAQQLYLDVCTFDRLGVPLRAGLLSRISGFSLAYFREHFFRPLEHVVNVKFHAPARDYAYYSRHPVIAELVFREVLSDPETRANQMIRIIEFMNVDFQSDAIAFEDMIRGRELADLFSDRALADRIFEVARSAATNMSHVEHQRAVFELRHPEGDPHTALSALANAEARTDRGRPAIRHTRAMALRLLAKRSRTSTQRDRLRSEAKMLLRRLVHRGRSSHAYHTLGELLMDEMLDYVKEVSGKEKAESARLNDSILSMIKEIEGLLRDGLRKFPRDSHLLDLESNFANAMDDEPRATAAMEGAVEHNPDDGFVVRRLARHYVKKGDIERAIEILTRCLEASPTDQETAFQLATTLRRQGEAERQAQIRMLLRRSFTPGDSNHEAQFWYARHEFLYGDVDSAEEAFDRLKASSVRFSEKSRIRGEVIDQNGSPKYYTGRVCQVSSGHCFVKCDNLQVDAFVPAKEFRNGDWSRVNYGVSVRFRLAFSMLGTAGVKAEIAG